jgi:predicted P-loop ATPase
MVEIMSGCWIMESPELGSVTRSVLEEIKAFFSASTTAVRMSYGRMASNFPRQCVFMGSTNERHYLVDYTGNRRFWPIHCGVEGPIDTDRLESVIDQVWAEVYGWYVSARTAQPFGTLPLHLESEEAQALAKQAQEDRRQESPMDSIAGRALAWLMRPKPLNDHEDGLDNAIMIPRRVTCAAEVWMDALGNTKIPTRLESIEITKALESVGWVANGKTRRFGHHGPQRAFIRTPTADAIWASDDEDDGTNWNDLI